MQLRTYTVQFIDSTIPDKTIRASDVNLDGLEDGGDSNESYSSETAFFNFIVEEDGEKQTVAAIPYRTVRAITS